MTRTLLPHSHRRTGARLPPTYPTPTPNSFQADSPTSRLPHAPAPPRKVAMKRKIPRRSLTALAVTAALTIPLLGPAGQAGAAEGTVHIVEVHNVDADKDAVTRLARTMVDEQGGELRRIYHSATQAFSAVLTEEEVARYLKDTRVSSVTQDRTYRVVGEEQQGRGTPPPPRPTLPGSTGQPGAADTQESPDSWGLDRIDQRELPLDDAYTYPHTAQDVTVYVVDTGVRIGHEEFGGRARGVYDAVEDTARGAGEAGTDCHGHGTAMAATIGGERSGVAKGVDIASVRAVGCDGQGQLEHLMSAVDWIATHAEAPALVNLGFSGPPGSVLDLQLYEMTRLGIAYTAPAGDGDGSGTPVDSCETTPGRQTTAITVSGTDASDVRAGAANYGTCVHLFAPGEALSTATGSADDAYTEFTGTSIAAATAAGAAALYLHDHPQATPAELDEALIDAATKDLVQEPGKDSPNRLLFMGPQSTQPDSAQTDGTQPSGTPSEIHREVVR